MAHAYTADTLYRNLRASSLHALPQRVKQLVATLRHAARAETNIDLRQSLGNAKSLLRGRQCCFPFLAGTKFSNDLGCFLGCRMSKGVLPDAHNGRQSATAETRNLFDSELSVLISVLASRNSQLASEGILDPLGAGHMASRAAAHPYDVFADRFMPEYVIKGGDAGD
jgi:hypothetical protein